MFERYTGIGSIPLGFLAASFLMLPQALVLGVGRFARRKWRERAAAKAPIEPAVTPSGLSKKDVVDSGGAESPVGGWVNEPTPTLLRRLGVPILVTLAWNLVLAGALFFA